MDINELQSYRLSDAVKFNDQLNPRLWGSDEHLLPEVKEKLLTIADDFREFLGIDVEVKDITISGSNAAYTYTPHSDIDLHLVVDLPRADESDVYRELFDAKKYAYNDQHDFKIGGYDVELYVQDANKPHHSQGIYSLKDDDWVRVPSRRQPEIDDISVKSKYEDIGQRIEAAIASGDLAKMDAMATKLRNFRQAGLDAHGEFGPENLAFKILRGNGTLDKLRDARRRAKDELMSITERKKKRGKKKFRYGSYGGYYFPGYGYYGQTGSTEATDGGGDGGGESVRESAEPQDTESLLRRFIAFTAGQIGIQDMPQIRFKRDPAWTERNNTFGRYMPETNTLIVSLANRHPLDIMRTVAHELIHHRQNEIAPMPDESGETGSDWENEANAGAGIIMRRFSDLHPEYFSGIRINEVDTAQDPQPGDPIDWPEGTVHVKVSDVYDWYKLGQKLSDLSTAKKGEFGSGVPETILVFNNEPQEEAMIDQLEKLGLDVHDVDPGETPGQERPGDVDESLRGRVGAAVAAACVAGTPGCATTDAVKAVQTVGRTAQTLKGIKPGDAREELTTAVKDALRKGTGTRESAEQKPQDPVVQYDIPYTAIARPERLWNVRRYGEISHYKRSGHDMAMISVPVSKERAFVDNMRNQGIIVKKSQIYEASGYIPTEAERDDPRYSMALTVDVHPGQTGKEANKLGLETDPQGRPALLMKKLNNLLESVKNEDCWDGYRQQGMKRKGDRMVPNCVPVEEAEKDVPETRGGWSHDPADIEKIRAWRRVETDTQSRMFQGYTMKFSPDGMFIYRGGDLVYKKLGDFSNPSNQDIATAKSHVTRLINKAVTESVDEEDLFEVKMSPGELTKWAQSPDAEGIKAGFEAEMIFRDAASGEDEESEPDYDMDERAETIEGVVDFFRGGEFGISGGTANRLRDALWEDYVEWRDEQIYDAWEKEADEQVEEYMETHVWGDDEQRDEYLQQAAAELDIADMSEATPEQTQEIEQLAREKFAEDVQFQIKEQGPYYDEARDDYRDHMADADDFSEYEYFRDRGGAYMSDVADQQSLDWPYWTEGSYNGGGRDVNEIADSLSEALGGAEVRGSTGYHSTRRRPGLWIIEPDGSLNPDDSDDAGLEIVSPPMPLPQTLAALRKVIDWANSNNGDAYTNDSTGLHMGISVPFKGGNVDYVKLILFLGDQYVLDKFGRAANSYTRSALGKLQDVQRRRKELDEQEVQGWDSRPATMTGVEKTAAAMDLMKKNLIELAAGMVQDGVGRDKYTSAHIKDGYIEFRSPGGDYLAMDNRDESELSNTMLRFARAMQIASRPDLERKEYSKKLYKLLSGFKEATTVKTGRDTKYRTEIETYDDKDALELFAKYSTGQINAEELKKAWARGVLAREQPRDRRGEKWEIYDQGTGEVLDVVSGENEADLSLAIANAMGKHAGRDVNIRKQGEKTEPSRRAKVAKKIIDRPTVWHIEDGTDGRVILIDAPDVATARDRARQRDPEFNLLIRMNPDQLIIKPATAAEVDQYQQQQADNKKDSEQVQQRVQGTQDRYNMYVVNWTERRGDGYGRDSLRVSAANADAAMDSVRSALNAQDRDVISIEANLAGSTRDLQQQRAQQAASQPPGEFTGRWQVQDIQGRVLHTFGGIGNSQADANRVARQWAEQNGFRQSFEVVPEMR